MRHSIKILKAVFIAAAIWAVFNCAPASAALNIAAHRLEVQIDPAEQALSGHDLVTVTPAGADQLKFRLSPRASIQKVEMAGRPREYSFENGLLTVPLIFSEKTASVKVLIVYRGIFDDSAPLRPITTDNPGYGVMATISELGGFLLPGAAWYPEMLDASATYQLKVTAPKGWLAVTSGRLEGHRTESDASVSEWAVTDPVEGLALSVGPFKVTTRRAGKFKASTYFRAAEPDLAAAYLDATLQYLELYSQKFGDYAFDQFVIVENFFQTGYGFPGYTVLGSRVLRLPFIISTSLGHEIAHCWWGNAVTVDYSQGNWSEALTTYAADYLYKERESPEQALAYRRQILRAYASLVTPSSDFPLAQFTARRNPLTKSVGYDKGAMVFHMLRRLIGDEAFWGALKDVYRQRRFKDTAWDDLQLAFESRAGRPLGGFFDQWVTRKGVPQFRLVDVDLSRPEPSGQWLVSGSIQQEADEFRFPVQLRLETVDDHRDQTIEVTGRRTAFQILTDAKPTHIRLDPQIDLMRRLYPNEIPPTVNALKGAAKVTLLLSDKGPETNSAAQTLMASMGLSPLDIIYLDTAAPPDLPSSDILVVGEPPTSGKLGDLVARIVTDSGAVELNGEIYDQPGDVFFGVFAHPQADGRVVGILWPLGSGETQTARKITHYGKYSYLLFRKGRNLAKDTWPVENSPLEYHW